MSESNRPLTSPDLAKSSATRLLHLALAPAVQPADLLLEHALAQRDVRWFHEALARHASEATLSEGSPAGWCMKAPDAGELASLRSQSKRAYESALTSAARCEALFVYAFCVAASIVHLGTTASSERRDQIDSLLGAAAAAAPDDLREFLERALSRETAD